MKVYVTEMLRWGDEESHHYIIGTFSTEEKAQEAGDAERSFRGGKYEYRIVSTLLDFFPDEVIEYHKGCQ